MGVWAGLISGLLSGAAQAVVSAYTDKKRADAAQTQARNIKAAADKYTGKNALAGNQAYARENAARMNQLAQGIAASQPETQRTSFANAEQGAKNALGGNIAQNAYNQGYNVADSQNKAKLSNIIAQEQQKAAQANKEADALQQAVTGGLNTLGGAVKTGNDIGIPWLGALGGKK